MSSSSKLEEMIIIAAMLKSERSCRAVSSFCEAVMLQKEEAERERKRAPESRGLSRKKGAAGGGRERGPTGRIR